MCAEIDPSTGRFPISERFQEWIRCARAGHERPPFFAGPRSDWFEYCPAESQLYEVCNDPELILYWMQDLGLILSNDAPPACPLCGLESMRMRRIRRHTNGFRWECRNFMKKKTVVVNEKKCRRRVCGGTKSVRGNSFFSESKIHGSLGVMMSLLYKFAFGQHASQIVGQQYHKEAMKKTLSEWFFWLRDVGSKSLVEQYDLGKIKLNFPVQWDVGHLFKSKPSPLAISNLGRRGTMGKFSKLSKRIPTNFFVFSSRLSVVVFVSR